MRNARWNVQEVAGWSILIAGIRGVDQCLESANVVDVSEVDHVDGNVVLSESVADILEVFFCSLDGMTYKDDDSLPLTLILSMF